jgi:short-subunit dehydrogenase
VTTLCPGPTESEFKVRAGSQRSRLFEAFVMDAPRVARVGYDAMMKGKAVAIPGLRNKMIPSPPPGAAAFMQRSRARRASSRGSD